MKQKIALIIMCSSFSLATITPMQEKEGIYENWVTPAANETIEWDQVRATISTHINQNYKSNFLQKPSTKKALSILKQPDQLFPDLQDQFSDSFFKRLCVENERFKTATTIILDDIKTYLLHNLNGENFNAIKYPHINQLSHKAEQYFLSRIRASFNKSIVYDLHTASPVKTMDFNEHRHYLAAGLRNSKVKIWDINTLQILQYLTHHSKIKTVSFNANGTLLVTTTKDGTITFWNSSNGIIEHSIKKSEYNRAFFSTENDDLFITFSNCTNNKDCQTITQWTLLDNNIPKQIARYNVPITEINNITNYACRPYTIEVNENDSNHIIIRKKDNKLNIYTTAFNNSKDNIELLTALQRKVEKGPMVPVDKNSILLKINDRIKVLTQNNKPKKLEDKGSFELKTMDSSK